MAVPGLHAEFYRRPYGDRVASVGRYWLGGQEVLLAWGYVDEQHCRHSVVRDPDGGWHHPSEGCPSVRVERDDTDAVAGLSVLTPNGEWLIYTVDRGVVAAHA
ncbi:hypothetical protein AB0M36_07965 [Actinoplanes sp. NPDC051346]|uniref:hypothetical protein n=1 Tax=Actinoplanes sp. NPDC051346 TaxID=3155048 RepID=UPI00341E08BF